MKTAKHVMPKYRRISDLLKEQILNGIYKSGYKLPSEKELSQQYDISRVTTRQAMAVLEKEHLIIRKRGDGTYVNQLGANGIPLVKLRHLGFVLIDEKPHTNWYFEEIKAAERWLAKYNVLLSISSVKSEEFISGHQLPILQTGSVQGLLIDGFVQTFHSTIPKNVNLPYFVIGNHKIDKEIPQVRYAVKPVIRKMMKMMMEMNPDIPIALLVEPFVFDATKEIYQAYQDNLSLCRQKENILRTCSNQNGYDGVMSLLAKGMTDFYIITTDKIVSGVLQAYKDQGISIKTNPVFVIGNPDTVPQEEKEQIYFAPLCSKRIAIEGTKRLKNIIEKVGSLEAQENENCYTELDIDVTPPCF